MDKKLKVRLICVNYFQPECDITLDMQTAGTQCPKRRKKGPLNIKHVKLHLLKQKENNVDKTLLDTRAAKCDKRVEFCNFYMSCNKYLIIQCRCLFGLGLHVLHTSGTGLTMQTLKKSENHYFHCSELHGNI